MAFRLSRLLGSSGFGGRQVRKLSVVAEISDHITSDSSDSCYLISRYGQVKFPGDRLIPVRKYFEDVPFLRRVPADRLIEMVDQKSPFLTDERINKLIRSGLIALYLCKLRGISIPSLFEDGNVGILQGLDIFAFKNLDIQTALPGSEAAARNCYKPFLSFLKGLILKYVDPSDKLPTSYGMLLAYLELPTVKDRLVLYNPSLFPKHITASTYLEVYRLLREELPACGMETIATLILEKIDSQISGFLDSCSNNALLRSYSGLHGDKSSLFRSVTLDKGKSAEDRQIGDASGAEHANDDLAAKKQFVVSSIFWHPVMGTKDLGVHGRRRSIDNLVYDVPGEDLTAAILEAVESVRREDVGDDYYERITDGKNKLLKTLGRQRATVAKVLGLLQQKGMLMDLKMDPDGGKSKEGAVVDTHRHGIGHTVKSDNCCLIDLLPDTNRESLIKNPYDVSDVIDLFEHKCSEYLPVAVMEMDDKEVWHRLQLETLFPIPDIFYQ